MVPKKVYKEAEKGRFVTKEYVKDNPKTTFTEKTKPSTKTPVKKKK